MGLPRATVAVLLPLGAWSQAWSSPWTWSNPGINPRDSHHTHAASGDDEVIASTKVASALGVEDPIQRAATLFETTNSYLETITVNVAQKIKCPMCLRGGEELARRTLTNKDEVALIDETANICRGSDLPDDGGWIGDLQDEGWEVHNGTLVQVVDEERRISDQSQAMIQAWILRRACYLVFPDGFEFAMLAEWLGMWMLTNEDAKQVDTMQTQAHLCLKMTKLCKGVEIKKSDRIAIPVKKKPKKAKLGEEEDEEGDGKEEEEEEKPLSKAELADMIAEERRNDKADKKQVAAIELEQKEKEESISDEELADLLGDDVPVMGEEL